MSLWLCKFMKRLFCILLFTFSFLFYWNTGRSIENRTEAEDVYEYALMVEQGAEHPWFYHAHHLLYGPLMREAYRTAQAFGYDGRAIDVMRLISALATAGTLFFFFCFCYKRYSLRPVSSLLATAFLGLSYGFWRYAAESEIPLIASFFITAALYYATDPEGRKRDFIWAILFSVMAVLIHIMNAVAVFVAIPAFYLIRGRFKALSIHLLLCAFFSIGIYVWADQVVEIHGNGRAHFSMINFGTFIKAAIAFVQCVISCDFMLGFSSVRAFLAELFASRMLLDEFYLGMRLSRIHILFSTLTYILFFTLFGACLGRAFWLWKNIAMKQERFHLPRGLKTLITPALFLAGYGTLLLFIEPGNPELWVIGLIPFSLLFCGVVLLPLTADNRLWIPFLMVVVLLVHNAGAVRMLQKVDGDYQQNKAILVFEHADENDVVITAGNPVFERYLRYHFKGTVLYLYNMNADELGRAHIPDAEGEIYVLGDVFEQPASLKVRFPGKTAEIEVFADQIKSNVKLIQDDHFGGIYRLERGGVRE